MEFPHPLPDYKPVQVKSRTLLSYKQKKVDEANKYKGEFLTDYMIYF